MIVVVIMMIIIVQRSRRLDVFNLAFQRIHIIFGAHRSFGGGVLGFFLQQGLTVLFGNLIIVRVDFAERQKAMAVAAIFNKGRLQRRFNPGYLGEVNIAFELFMLCRFEIKFFDTVTFDDRDTGFFPVARVYQHTRCHVFYSRRCGLRLMRRRPRDMRGTGATADAASRKKSRSRGGFRHPKSVEHRRDES